jgi:hypothetical protein
MFMNTEQSLIPCFSQVLEATHIPHFVVCSIFRASKGQLSLSLAALLRFHF